MSSSIASAKTIAGRASEPAKRSLSFTSNSSRQSSSEDKDDVESEKSVEIKSKLYLFCLDIHMICS